MGENKNNQPDYGEDAVFDQSSRAEAVLDRILHVETEAEDTEAAKAKESEVAITEELSARPILDRDTGRDKTRVLFVTTNDSVFVEGSEAGKAYLNLAGVFDEVHVMVLIPRSGKDSFLRAKQNVWFYKVHGNEGKNLGDAALQAAKEALTWNGTVRPDIIVGVDPFEAGLGAYQIAQNFSRPLQIHVRTDFLDDNFLNLHEENKEKRRLADRLLRQVKSVRIQTAAQKKKLAEQYSQITDLEALPRFYNFSALGEATPGFNLHEKYPDLAFIMLTFGPLSADSHLHDVFSALHRLLLNPRIGLVVVGDGPAKRLFEDKVKLLGLGKNVIFQKQADDLVSYLKTSDLLVEADVSEDSEIRVLQAASCGAAIVAYETDLRRDLFEDGRSAFLCPPRDMLCLGQKVNKFINTPALRTEFKELSLHVASERLHEDKGAYFRAFRDTIESVLVPPETKETKA